MRSAAVKFIGSFHNFGATSGNFCQFWRFWCTFDIFPCDMGTSDWTVRVIFNYNQQYQKVLKSMAKLKYATYWKFANFKLTLVLLCGVQHCLKFGLSILHVLVKLVVSLVGRFCRIWAIFHVTWDRKSLSCVMRAIKQNESELGFFVENLASFQLQCMPHILSYSLVKTPSKLDLRFQNYRNITIFLALLILKSILASSDSFCLITSHVWCDQAKSV